MDFFIGFVAFLIFVSLGLYISCFTRKLHQRFHWAARRVNPWVHFYLLPLGGAPKFMRSDSRLMRLRKAYARVYWRVAGRMFALALFWITIGGPLFVIAARRIVEFFS